MVDTVNVKRCSEGSSGRMATLQARKQALQEELAARNEELRRLCIQEAELTGSMPPEVPLEPGESPPPFRRMVGTGYAYPQNLINKLKTNEVESIAALELEKQVQVGISEAALGLVHNGAASKAARRKNRLVYQQSQKRLTELDERLGYLMAARNDQKPQQQSQPNKYPSPNTQQTNSTPQQQIHPQYSPQLLAQQSSPSQMQSPQLQTRQQHYSTLNPPSTSATNQPTKYKKKPRPATIDLDKEHHNRTLHHSNSSTLYSTHSMNAGDHNPRLIHHERLERTTSAIHPPRPQQVQLAPHQQYDTGLGGYWMCLDTGETVWCSVEPNYWQRETRFGSLDRSKTRPLQHKWSAPSTIDSDETYRHHVNPAHIKTLPDLGKHSRLQQDMFADTASKLSENWHVLQAHSLGNVASQVDSANVIPPYRDRMATGNRKYKQKKWYETSLDAPPLLDNSGASSSSTNQHHSGSLESMLPPHSPYHHSPLTTPTKSSLLSPKTPSPHPPPPTPPARVPSLELSVEPSSTTTFSNSNSNTVPLLQSPKNCTVIQPGQWKPYREVTKPFEMSDFYKYSTKFRNRNSNNNNQTTPNDNEIHKTNEDKLPDNHVENGFDTTDSVNNVVYHKGIYQPLQPMKCQPFHHNNSPNGLQNHRTMTTSPSNTMHSIVEVNQPVHNNDQSSNKSTLKKVYSTSSPLVPVDITSHQLQNSTTTYGQQHLVVNYINNNNNNNNNLNTSSTSNLKNNNSMPTSTLV